MFKYSIKRGLYLFRTGIILTLQNKDDSFTAESILSLIRKLQHLSPTATREKYGQGETSTLHSTDIHSAPTPSWQGIVITYTYYALYCGRKGPWLVCSWTCCRRSWETDRPFARSETNRLKNVLGLFCTSCVHLVASRQVTRFIEQAGEWGQRT